MSVVIKGEHLDLEWIQLMKEAKDLGLTTDEIRLFLKDYQESSICS